MALLNNQHPRIQTIVPHNGASDVPLSDPIKIVFNTYMDESTINPSNIFLEIDGESYNTPDVRISIEYDNLSKSAIITPIDPLSPGVTYRVIISRKVRSSLGVSPLIEISDNTFTTTTKGYLPPPKLLFPSNESLIAESTPTFSWEKVGGATKYEIQVSSDKNFSDILWGSEDVSSESITSGTEIEVGDNTPQFYYWRVRAYDDSDTPAAGEWSDRWVFNNALYTSDPVALESYIMSIMSVKPLPSEVNVALGTKSIYAEFDQDIDPASVDGRRFYVTYKPIDGNPSISRGVLEGDVTVNGSRIRLDLDEELKPNMEYMCILDENIRSINGIPLEEDISWSFISQLDPLYVGVELIRDDIGRFIDMYNDDDIFKIIHDVSKDASRIASQPYGEIINFTTRETNVRDYEDYVRYTSEVRLLNRRILEIAQEQGKRKRLGDLEIQNDTSLVPDINIVLRPVQVKAKEAENRLRAAPKVRPRAVTRGGEYPYNSRQW